MLSLGKFCRLPFQIHKPALSSARQLIDGMSKRKNLSMKALPVEFGYRIDENFRLSVPKLLELAALNRTKFVRAIVDCIPDNDILTAKQLHCFLVKCGFSSNPFIGSTLISVYSKNRLVDDARTLFDDILVRDLVLWNVMVSSYSQNGLGEEAFGAFKLMRVLGFIGDGFTFSSLLSSCSLCGCRALGKQTHALAIKLAYDLDVVVGTALIDMYVKCGCILDARKAFDILNRRNIVSWNAIIVGYGQLNDGKEAMKLLRQMTRQGSKPDELTFASVLSSCAHLAMANEAIQVHDCLMKKGFQSFVSIGNALVAAYAKSGCISSALHCFESLSKPDLISWTSMVSAYTYHGLAKKAIEMFERMVFGGVRPDEVAFLGVLSACSHAGLVERALHYFASMKNEYQIEPSSEHYTCLIDALGRSGRLGDACDVIVNMPLEPNGAALGAFMGACEVQGNAELAKWAADRVIGMEPDESVNYKLMSSAYAASGRWNDVARVRKLMRGKCGDSRPGCSWIESGEAVHSFRR